MAGPLLPPSYARCPGLNLRYFRRPRPPNRYTHPFSSVPAYLSDLYSDMTWSSYSCGYIYMYYAYELLPIFLRKRLGFLPNTCSATSDVTDVMTATLSATEEGSHFSWICILLLTWHFSYSCYVCFAGSVPSKFLSATRLLCNLPMAGEWPRTGHILWLQFTASSPQKLQMESTLQFLVTN
jgi:hypothetical protein